MRGEKVIVQYLVIGNQEVYMLRMTVGFSAILGKWIQRRLVSAGAYGFVL